MIFASGPRCGSTLLQRLLCSHPHVLIWGEQGGALKHLFAFMDQFEGWDESWGDKARKELAMVGYDGFIANLMPPLSRLREGTRSLILQLFAEPAAELGRPRWGFKEIRYGRAECVAILSFFPGTKIVHLTRDPRDVLISLDWWERSSSWSRSDTRSAMQTWADINESLIGAPLPSCHTIRFEDLTADPAAGIARIARWFDLDVDDLDHTVFERRVHSWGQQEKQPRTLRAFSELPADLREIIASAQFSTIARYFGYDIRE
ncbi:MAG: sulfotransferase family protein [Pseudonocardiaceae bacterium]